jgi:hypothetical protein
MPKYVLAEFSCYSRFLIPEGIDLDTVKWWVKHNTLHIELENGETLEIEPEGEVEVDAKYPTNTEIVEEDD